MPQGVRSVLAVIAGYLAMMIVVIVLTVIVVKAFHLQSGHPTPAYLTLNILYSLAAALLGGFVAAKIARRSPLAHGIALELIMLALSLVNFSTSAGGQPLGYRIFVVVALPLAAIAGAATTKNA
jgi:hypothetical protein